MKWTRNSEIPTLGRPWETADPSVEPSGGRGVPVGGGGEERDRYGQRGNKESQIASQRLEREALLHGWVMRGGTAQQGNVPPDGPLRLSLEGRLSLRGRPEAEMETTRMALPSPD